ncbi:MAG: hypothetical protein IPK83_23015 [Planctomycetes bacterium]|nr:hypothetical protein [Planctomycetota bacterium]
MIDVNGPDNVLGSDDDDVHVAAGSPCIESGDPAYAPPAYGLLDLDGQPRIMGCVVDIGADEVLGAARNSGDMNSSGSTDLADVPVFVAVALNGGTPGQICIADMNNDGVVNGNDIQEFTDAVIAP